MLILIGCYYHYKSNLIKNARNFRLMGKNLKLTTKNLISQLGLLSLKCNGEEEFFDNYVIII